MALVFNPFTGNFDFAGGDATASLLNLKGQVATVGALPSSGNTIGDVWQVTADLTFRVWDGAAWDDLGTFQGPAGQNVELQKTATHIQWRVVGGTWANLVALSEITGPAGTGITDGDKGDITVSAGGSTWTIDNGVVDTAVTAWWAASPARSKLDGVAAGAEVNVNADWSATSGDAQILNKPTLGSAAALNVGTAAGTVAAGDDARLNYNAPFLALGDETTAATSGTKVTVHHWPIPHRLTAIPLWSASAPVGSVALQFDIRVGGTSIFSTLPTIAVGGTSSTTTTAAVFSTAFVTANQTIAAGSLVTFHVTQAPSGGGGAGAKVLMPAVRV